jgi:glucose/arabinose dehydrogenase
MFVDGAAMTKESLAVLRLLALISAALIAACGDDDDENEATPPPPPPAPLVLGVEPVFANLSFTQPVALLQAPADPTQWFVVEQRGRVLVFANNPQAVTAGVFADITDRVTSGGEMGLLGMAFHPNFPADARIYLSYSNETAGHRVNRVSEFTLGAAGTVNAASERILMSVDQPEGNHNGGQITFGPDGFLYIGRGDGGGRDDQHGTFGNAQLTTTLLGKILRIDVSPTSGYAIPSRNLFAMNPQCGASGVGMQACPEIFALGFRNPWRFSFDRGTGTFWVGDVGQDFIEEINRVAIAGNYGWRCLEGTRLTGFGCGPASTFLPPIAEYGRAQGGTVIGGYVYRGTSIPGLVGRYVFGDFISGRIWHIAGDTQPTMTVTGGTATDLLISSFGEDVNGELYVVDYVGKLYRVVSR